MILLGISFFVMIYAGVMTVRALESRAESDFEISLYLGSGLGVGIASALYFTLLNLLPASSIPGWWVCEITLATAATAIYVRNSKHGEPAVTSAKTLSSAPSGQYTKYLKCGFFASFLISLVSFIAQCWAHPHGDWDALMIWNTRARFLERAPMDIHQAFSTLIFWSLPDYPLLIPSVVSLGYGLSQESQLAPITFALIFTFVGALLLYKTCAFFRSRAHGYFAAMVLLTTPLLISNGSMLMSDVPIAFFFLAAIVSISLYDRTKHTGYIALCGLFASMAAWTKNEGLIFIPSIVLASLLVDRSRENWRGRIIAFLAGVTPVLLVVIYFKLKLSPPNYLAGQSSSILLSRALNPARIITIIEYFAVNLVTFGNWLVSPIPMFVLLWLMTKSKIDNVSSWRAIYTAIFMLAGYAFVFLITPFDLNQQLATAADRLFMQLCPITIFALVTTVTFDPALLTAVKKSKDSD